MKVYGLHCFTCHSQQSDDIISIVFFFKFPFLHSLGEDEELGPPPSVDEAADALMTRLGFLLGEKVVSGEPGSPYHAQDGQVSNTHAFVPPK